MTDFTIVYFRARNRNNEYAVIIGLEQWPYRSLIAKGWAREKIIYSRPATPEEELQIRNSHRCLASRYKDLPELLKDEERVLAERPEELQKLKEALEKAA